MRYYYNYWSLFEHTTVRRGPLKEGKEGCRPREEIGFSVNEFDFLLRTAEVAETQRSRNDSEKAAKYLCLAFCVKLWLTHISRDYWRW